MHPSRDRHSRVHFSGPAGQPAELAFVQWDNPPMSPRLLSISNPSNFRDLAAHVTVPHGLRPRAGSLRARVGEQVRAVETAALDDACVAAMQQFSNVFVVRPLHNPIGPFDFAGVYDEASDRRRNARELLQQGYEDAYAAFIDPYVAAGERIDQI